MAGSLGRIGAGAAMIVAWLFGAAGLAAEPTTAAGRVEDSSEWRDFSNPSRPAKAFGRGMRVNGWLFFGSDQLIDNFGDTSNRIESLPACVAQVAVARGARVACFAGYSRIPVPQNKQYLAGTLTLSDLTNTTELLAIRVGADAPAMLRLAVLVDNLGTPDYVSREISLAINGRAGPGTTVPPNGKPDWLFWDLRGLKEGTEISLRAQPDKGVATVGGLLFLSASADVARKPANPTPLPLIDRKIGVFSRAGEYVKDHFIHKEGDTFHLFYNVGNAGASQNWDEPGNEKAFGHATSKDLNTWQHHPRILEVVPGTWEGDVVSAPSIIKHADTYYMLYTGFDDRVKGRQAIGLATSKDLFHWVRHPRNPVYEAPPWAKRRADGWIDCRDPHVIRHGNEFLLFTMTTTLEDRGAIALATSVNLTEWKDLGPAVVTFRDPESPRVFRHGDAFYLFTSSAHGKELLRTADPKHGPWKPVPFCWPAPGLWSGWEVVDVGERTVFSAFEWKPFGNHIWLWDVRWNDGVPSVVF